MAQQPTGLVPQSAASISIEETKLMLFVGPGDSGKSYASTSFGLRTKEYGGKDSRPCYMIELDGRIAALRNRPVMYNSFTNEDGVTKVLHRIEELREQCVKNKVAPFHTLIVDSTTSFGDLAVAESMETKGSAGRSIGKLELLTVEDYGFEAEAFRQLLWESLMDIKKYCDVIVTAHQTELYKTAATKPGAPTRQEWDGKSYKILMHGNKIANKLPTKFDEIYEFANKELIVSSSSMRRSVRFQGHLARTSYPQLAKNTADHDISGKEFYTYWKSLLEKV